VWVREWNRPFCDGHHIGRSHNPAYRSPSDGKGGSWCPKNPAQACFSLWSATGVLPRPGVWPTVLPIGLRRRISSQSNNAGCPWPAAMRPKRSGRRLVRLRDPSANSEVVTETGGGQTSRGPRTRLRLTHLFKSCAFSRTSSAVRPKNPATSANDIPRSSESFKKNRSALAHGLSMSARFGSCQRSRSQTFPYAYPSRSAIAAVTGSFSRKDVMQRLTRGSPGGMGLPCVRNRCFP
jgi:hypothetical protein